MCACPRVVAVAPRLSRRRPCGFARCVHWTVPWEQFATLLLGKLAAEDEVRLWFHFTLHPRYHASEAVDGPLQPRVAGVLALHCGSAVGVVMGAIEV